MNFDRVYREPRVYAYTLPSVPEKAGWIKVGYTDRQTVQERIAQQLKTPSLRYRIELDESARTRDGRFFDDRALHYVLEEEMGIEREYRIERDGRSGRKRRIPTEWFKTNADGVRVAVKVLQGSVAGREEAEKAAFAMRPEQKCAVAMTAAYFRAHPKERGGQPPSFLWNAKMRFGKTFATYQLAKKMGWRKILVMTSSRSWRIRGRRTLRGTVTFPDGGLWARRGAAVR